MKFLIKFLIKNKLLVVLAMVGIIIWGVVQYRQLPTDAFPDISPVMVPVFAEAHGMAPEEVERLITIPIESEMNGLPGVKQVKSTSAFGMAVVYVYFSEETDIYFARQIVSERLAGADLPEMEEKPILGPISTGLGEVFMYYLTADDRVDTEGKSKETYLREINDWTVKYQLQTVPGVTEILSMGGFVLQYQIDVNPLAMNKYGLVLDDVVSAVNNNNRNAGGQFIVTGSEEYLVRGIGLFENLTDLKNVHLKTVNGVSVRLNEIAEINFGKEIRRGVVTRNGEEEVVAGIVMKLYGQNTSEIIKLLEDKIPEIQNSLPAGVKLVPYYNQKTLVDNAVGTVSNSLWQGAILVILVLIMFLGNFRSAFIVAVSLPLCALIAAIFMGLSGMSANLMSLGGIAIAIGMLGDASIVIVENIFRHLSDENNKNASVTEIIISSSSRVVRPIIFSVAIIIIVFLPLFTLEGVEGKMFKPMAFTITFALIGSLFAALVFSPVLSSLILRKEVLKEFFLLLWIKKIYGSILNIVLKFKVTVVIFTLIAFGISVSLIPKLGTEFIPVLEEGIIQLNVVMAPSISLEKATSTIMNLEKRIKRIGEVDMTLAKIGRPEAGSHPHPVNSAHIQVMLKPVSEWKDFKSKSEIVDHINKDLSDYPGVMLNFSQPIQNMFDELLSGVKTQIAIKVFGEDLSVLQIKAEEINEAIVSVEGLVDLSVEQNYGQPQLRITADRDACDRYGVNVSDILEIVELGIGGQTVDQIFLNNRRFGIQVRLDEDYIVSADAIGDLLVHNSTGFNVPLSQVANIESVIGPIQISRESSQRRWVVSANVRGRDLGSVVNDIKELVSEKVNLPPGYYVEYGGQFENQQRAMGRLMVIVPAVLGLIFILLYIALGSLKSALLIFINIPLALIGGILGLYYAGEYLSVPASIGFIALFGIAVQNGLVLVSYINQLREEGISTSLAIRTASLLRLRPVIMTALTTILGLVPLLISTGMGSEVQRPLAIVVVYGLISSTFLTLILIPVLYKWFAPVVASDEVLLDK